MKNAIFIFALLIFQTPSFTQNLLPNGSFESIRMDFEYTDPVSAFMYLDSWFQANYYSNTPIYQGTPDLFDYTNRWPLSDPPNFWNRAVGAKEGNYHVGIANHFLYEGYLQPEAICTPLVEALEAGAYYHVELQVRNKGVSGYENDPILCPEEGYKEIEILWAPDTIQVVIEKDEKDSYFIASKNVSLSAPFMETWLASEWQKVGTCFQADGGEQFMAITLTNGRFEVNSPCVIHEEHFDAFYVYYFDIDDVKLTRIPNEYTFQQAICVGRSTKINIADLVNLPIMQNEIEYHWEDGRVDSVNYVSQAGTYLVDVVIDCKTILVTLNITDSKCEPNIFIPNAISPNDDGINDELEIQVFVDAPIVDFQFSIFNRWGVEVFSTEDYQGKWDGTFGGQKLDSGVYTWSLAMTVDDLELGNQDFYKSGDVVVIW